VWEHEVDDELERVVGLIEGAVAGHPVQTLQWRVVEVEPLEEGKDWERRHFERLRMPSEKLVYEGARNSRSGRLLCPGLGDGGAGGEGADTPRSDDGLEHG
jgi:hypothetical protein